MNEELVIAAIAAAKLTIELVPDACWFSNVRDHITFAQWDKIRKQTAQRANFLCEICGSKGKRHPVECHEIWNYDDQAMKQTLDGLIALCPACHRVKHIGLASVKGELLYSIYHLMRVNQWSEGLAEFYVNVSFRVWEKRSEYDWTLDLSYIRNNFGFEVKEKR